MRSFAFIAVVAKDGLYKRLLAAHRLWTAARVKKLTRFDVSLINENGKGASKMRDYGDARAWKRPIYSSR